MALNLKIFGILKNIFIVGGLIILYNFVSSHWIDIF